MPNNPTGKELIDRTEFLARYEALAEILSSTNEAAYDCGQLITFAGDALHAAYAAHDAGQDAAASTYLAWANWAADTASAHGCW